MRLYVKDPETRARVHLQIVARNRQELVAALGDNTFEVQGKKYSVDEVMAESSSDNTAISALIGGVIGMIGGGAGIAVGGLLGGIIGKSQAEKENAEAEAFNRSSI